MTKRKWTAGFILIACGLITILFIREWNGHSDIAAGHISYTYNCAWVDWKHARPGGIKIFVDEFSQKFEQTQLDETFKITYEQHGGFSIKSQALYSYGISKEYEVLKFSEDETVKKKLMFHVFKDLSYLFENQQKEVLWGALRSSAFRDGDLMGNLIGFYIACGEITQEEASRLCEKLPISLSLQLKKEGEFQANNSFIPAYRIVIEGKAPIFPVQLRRYNDLEGVENYIRPLEEKEAVIFFGKKW